MLPGIARCYQVLPDVARCRQVLPDIARCCQVLPDVARCRQVPPGSARCCQVPSSGARFCQVPAGAGRCGQLAPSCERLETCGIFFCFLFAFSSLYRSPEGRHTHTHNPYLTLASSTPPLPLHPQVQLAIQWAPCQGCHVLEQSSENCSKQGPNASMSQFKKKTLLSLGPPFFGATVSVPGNPALFLCCVFPSPPSPLPPPRPS